MRLGTTWVALLLLLGVPVGARAQLPDIPGLTDEGSGADEGSGQEPAAEPPTAIPIPSIPERASDADARLQNTLQAIRPSSDVEGIQSALPALAEEVAADAAAARPNDADLDRRELLDSVAHWRVYDDQVTSWRRLLRRRSQALQREHDAVAALRATWEATRRSLRENPAAPPSAVDRTDEVLAQIRRVEDRLAARTDTLVSLQDQLDLTAERISRILDAYRSAQARVRDRLLTRTSPPLWGAFRGASYAEGAVPALRAGIPMDGSEVHHFLQLYEGRLALDLFLLAALIMASVFLSRRAIARAESAGETPDNLLRHPIEGSLLLALVASRFVYPRATYVFYDCTAILSLLPLARALPALVTRRSLLPPLYAMLVVFGIHRGVALLDFRAPWSTLALMAIATLALVDVAYAMRREGARPAEDASRLVRMAPRVLRGMAGALGVGMVGGVFGYTLLLDFLVEGIISSVYWMLVMIAVTKVVIVFVGALLGSRRIASLPSMQKHGDTIRQRSEAFARLVGILLWVYATLYGFDLYDPLSAWVRRALSAEATLGSWSVSLRDVLAFGITMYLATKLARLVSFVLEEEILSRMSLSRGVPATTSRLTRYLVVGLGFIFAVGAAGVDMSKVALLASALSVGIGFGLQNVVNNFVSGLILIFERPVRVGDTVEVGGLVGEVREIGIRASTVRTFQGAEVIVPNADLISNQVVNWTLSDNLRRVDVSVGVAYGTDPNQVIALLQDAANEIEEVVPFPPPTGLFVGFGDSSLDFQVRVWVRKYENWMLVQSRVLLTVCERLGQADIEVPFPQRDLHLRSVDEGAAARLRGKA